MSQTDQQPFSFDLFQPAQEKLPEAAQMFNMSEHRLDDYLASVVQRASGWTLQLLPHLCSDTAIGGSDRRLNFVRLHIQVDPLECFITEHCTAEISSISQNYFRHLSEVLFYFLYSWSQLPLVIGPLHHSSGDNNLRLGINGDLAVIGLHVVSGGRVHHQPRIRISQVALRLGAREGLAGFRLRPLATAIIMWASGATFFLLLLLHCCFFGFAFQLGLQLADLRQACLPLAQLCRQLIAPLAFTVKRVFLVVDPLSFSQQPPYFSLQFFLYFTHPGVAQRLTLRRIGLNLGAVNGHLPQLYQSRSLAQLQHLHKQLTQLFQVSLAKLSNAVVVRLLIARQDPKSYVIISGPLELARRYLAYAVAVDQQFDHHRRMIRRPTPQVALFITAHDRREVQSIHHIADIERQMLSRQPLPQVRRQEQQLTQVIRSKCFAHLEQFTYSLIAVYDFFSDRLLRGRRHKAWGVSPRIEIAKRVQPAERATAF